MSVEKKQEKSTRESSKSEKSTQKRERVASHTIQREGKEMAYLKKRLKEMGLKEIPHPGGITVRVFPEPKTNRPVKKK
jgi:hypothetical protein